MWHEWRTDIQQVSRERKGPWNYVTRAPNVSVERVGCCCGWGLAAIVFPGNRRGSRTVLYLCSRVYIWYYALLLMLCLCTHYIILYTAAAHITLSRPYYLHGWWLYYYYHYRRVEWFLFRWQWHPAAVVAFGIDDENELCWYSGTPSLSDSVRRLYMCGWCDDEENGRGTLKCSKLMRRDKRESN
jgi:hypothetical protein